MTPLEHAESKVHESFMHWQFAKTPTEQREAGDSLTRAIKERNALRTPEEVAEIERAKGLR